METLILFGILATTYLMVIAKRMPALIRGFRYQSSCLFIATAVMAAREHRLDLSIIAGLIFVLKICLIPYLLYRIIRRIRVNEDLGLFVNAQLSLVWALAFTYLAWAFAVHCVVPAGQPGSGMLAVAFFMVLAGLFLMMSRMTALAQIIGLLAMENGIFLVASTVSGGMPFFVEISIFFDVLVSVLIMGFFVYRINKLFTHIDVNKLSRLKG